MELEPYVTAAQVRAYFGGISNVTLWRWIGEGMPVHKRGGERQAKRLFKLSECDAWYQDWCMFKRTENGGAA